MKFVELKKIEISEPYFNEVRETVTHYTSTYIDVEVWEGIEDEIPSFARTGQKAPEGFAYLRPGWKGAFDQAQSLIAGKNIPKTYFANFDRETVNSLGESFLEKGISEKTFTDWLEKMVGIYLEFSRFYTGPIKTISAIVGEKTVQTSDGEEEFMKDGTAEVKPGCKIRKFQYWWIPV